MQRYTINTSGAVAEAFGNEVVLINLFKGNYYSMRDEVSLAAWKLLEGGATKKQIVQSLINQFVVDEPTAMKSTDYLIEQLLNESLIISSPIETEESLVAEDVSNKKDFVFPHLEIYDDMQAMFLIDPVHDVDAVKGWPVKKEEDGDRDKAK
jgi:Coenzyme PQQ synthesis protein D (PqqD)